MSSLLSTATVTAVGLTCKAALNLGVFSIAVNGLQNLTDALAHGRRDNGQGIITVSNHISTLDDPVAWTVLPAHYYLSSRTTRWVLGASDIMFTNPIFSIFFGLGQTLETFRGKGVHQPSIDAAIQKLDQGDWVHLFGEGKVNRPKSYSRDETGVAHLPRFKWGMGRILMEASKPPVVIPLWLAGFDKLMPEDRKFPFKYIPKPGAQLSVTFGNPISLNKIQQIISSLENTTKLPNGWLKGVSSKASYVSETDEQVILRVRASITAIIQHEVESLGRSVCGDNLL